LFIYANVGADGSIGLGAGVTIRHLAEEAGAEIAVLASNNPTENTVTASQLPGPKKANLIWTLDRKVDAFGRFSKHCLRACIQENPCPGLDCDSLQHTSEQHDELPQTISTSKQDK
jgi:hypothetical protein